MSKTNIHNFGDYTDSLRAFTGRDEMTVTYDESTYTQLMSMTDEQFEAALYDESRYTARKPVRAAYAVAKVARGIHSWRNA